MKMNVRTTYPQSDEYEYETRLTRIDLDKERRKDVLSGNGFIVSSPKAIKDDVKDPNGIFSTKYGPGLQDINAFGNRYRCKCGHTTQRFYHGLTCEVCGTKVEFKDDKFDMFGYICLKDPYYIIHPNLFMSLSFLIGEREFMGIITPNDKKNEDGYSVETKKSKTEPFAGIGILGFYEQFDEIIDYYITKKPKKRDYYEDIIQNREKVFIQSIPVFTLHLRPYRIEGKAFHYEGTNAIYNIMANLVARINDDRIKMNRRRKPKNQLLFDLQMKYKKLYDEILKILSGKKGSVRALFGGRYNFTARSVIVPGPDMRIDEVALSYQCLCGLLQQRIINILHKSYSMRYNDAFKLLYRSQHQQNPIIREIIEGIIKSSGRGIPVLINRNPTLMIGGILMMYCTEICEGYTMKIPLEVLKGLEADFDGDTLTILYIINQAFKEAAENVLNPRNSMYISKNDGMFNNTYNHKRDTVINMNTLVYLSRNNYSEEQLAKIQAAISRR